MMCCYSNVQFQGQRAISNSAVFSMLLVGKPVYKCHCHLYILLNTINGRTEGSLLPAPGCLMPQYHLVCFRSNPLNIRATICTYYGFLLTSQSECVCSCVSVCVCVCVLVCVCVCVLVCVCVCTCVCVCVRV
jgi:hypothetical protein